MLEGSPGRGSGLMLVLIDELRRWDAEAGPGARLHDSA